MFVLRVVFKRLQDLGQLSRYILVAGNDVVVSEQVQCGECRPASQWIAGIGMRMQKAPRDIHIVKGIEYIVCCHDER